MLTDSVVGLLGGSLLKPAFTAGRRAWQAGRHYIDDATRLSSTLMDDLITWGWVFHPFGKPAVATAVGYAASDLIYETYFSKSPASSSSSYQQNGGAGGTEPMLSQESINWNLKNGYSMAATTEHACGIGHRLKKVRGKWMCVPKSSKKSRRY